MATETETYKFPKPDEDDFYDIGQFNQTMDLIDESLRAVVEKRPRCKAGCPYCKKN